MVEAPNKILDKTYEAPQSVILSFKIEKEQFSEFENMPKPNKAYLVFKRAFDFCAATAALIVLAIPMLIISLIIRATSKGSAIFVQKRVGKDGKIFNMYKFRTMFATTPKYLATADIEDPEKYITKTGKLLRRFSLDELPQIINIVKGDMSIIGPRPLIPEESNIHEIRQELGIYQLRPGMTGWAQVNGRDSVLPHQKVWYDASYLRDIGIKMDAKIFFITVKKVLGAIDVVEGSESFEQNDN